MSTSPLFSAALWKQRLVFWLGAITVGAFISILTLFSEWAVVQFLRFYRSLGFWLLLYCPFGMILTLWLTERFFAGAEKSGVPQVKAALAIHRDLNLRERFVSFRIAVGKVLLTNMALLSGGSLGLGGPAIQIGASIMTSMGRWARLPPHYLERGMIMAGSAAGFAALFSAPLAGIMFAIEEMGRSLEERISSLVIIAIVLSGISAYLILKQYVFLEARDLFLPFGIGWLAIPLCGTVGGLAGGLFSRLLIEAMSTLQRFRQSARLLFAALFGLLLALLALISDGTAFGTGYPFIKIILNAPELMPPLFPLTKWTATLITALSGVPGGLFVPSLSIGAGLGVWLHHLFPYAPITVVVMLAMVAFFSGMLQAPMTAFVLVMEITDTHELLLPLMATAFIATIVSSLVTPPLYATLTPRVEGMP